MRKIFILFLLLIPIIVNAQKIDFEQLNPQTLFFDKVERTGTVNVDSITVHSGKFSLCVSGKNSFATMPIMFDPQATELTVKGYYYSTIQNGSTLLEVSVESNEKYPMNHIVSSSLPVDKSSAAWQPFELKIPLCTQIAKCKLNFLTKGNATVWVDDIEVLIDGKPCENSVLLNKSKVTHNASSDKRYETDSKFRINTPLTKQQIDELSELCIEWGRLKYNHPAVRNGEYDWDAVLFELLPLTPQKRKEYLKNLLSNKDTKETPYSYYVNPVTGLSLPFFKNEKSYTRADYADSGIKLLAVFRLWNAIEHYYPYRSLVSNWEETLKKAIENVVNAKNALEYQSAIMTLLTGIEDTHAVIIDDEKTLLLSFGNRVWPFTANNYIDGKFVVNIAISDENNLKLGDAIVAIGKESMASYIEKNKKYVSASNMMGLARSLSMFLMLTPKQEELFTIERNGKQEVVTVKSLAYKDFAVLANNYNTTHPLKSSGKLADNIYYINIATIDNSAKQTITNDVKGYDYVVFDMRGYPNSQIIPYLIEQFMPECALASKAIKLKSATPGDFITCAGDYFGGEGKFTPKKIVILVDERTQSYSEYLTMILQTADNVITIGSQTAGADGNTTAINLPYGIKAKFTGVGILYPDGGQTQRVGVRIDEIVKPTIKGIREGRDEVLERAIEIIKKQK